MSRSRLLAAVAALGFALSGCADNNAGDFGFAMPFVGTETVGDAAEMAVHRPTDSQDAAAAISAVDALGSRVRDLAGETSSDAADEAGRNGQDGRGACRAGVRFFAPAPGRGIGSSETRDFFDSSCMQLARDAIALVRRAGGGETIDRTIRLYGMRSSRPVAIRRERVRLTHATFGRFGSPSVAGGFTATTASQLWIADRRQNVTDSETIVLPGGASQNRYCQDSAGFTPAGIPPLDASFGWQAGTFVPGSAMRVDDGSDFVTISALQSGIPFAGPAGSLAIVPGKPNTACPVAAPAYAVNGGSSAGAFTLPMRATYRRGVLWSLGVTGASFPGGYSFDATTTRIGEDAAGVCITGTLTSGSTQIATLGANAFGNGSLTVTTTGEQYRLVDWTVVR